jgi:hypothetical protein
VCIPTRLVLALVVIFLPNSWLPVAGAVALIGVGGLLYRTATFDDQQLGAFKQPVTWNSARPIHAIFWTVFAILALSKNSAAKLIPWLDVLFGVFSRGLHA